MKSHIVVLSLLLLCACGERAGSRSGPASNAQPERSADDPKARRAMTKAGSDRIYALTGTIRQVKREEGEVTIRHDKIPGLMGAMEMPFKIRDKAELEDLQVGDEVEGKLRVGSDSSELFDLTVIRPAIAPESQAAGTSRRTLDPGQNMPDFAMTTQEGKTLRLKDLRGKAVVMTFIYTRCPLPEFCPLMNRKFKDIANRIALMPGREDRVRLLSISFDPEHDTPEVLAKMAQLQGAKSPLWIFGVASHDELRKVAESLGLVYGPTGDSVIHNLVTAIIDPEGKLVRTLERGDWKTEDVVTEIRSVLPRDSHK
jgi:protein SCO1